MEDDTGSPGLLAADGEFVESHRLLTKKNHEAQRNDDSENFHLFRSFRVIPSVT